MGCSLGPGPQEGNARKREGINCVSPGPGPLRGNARKREDGLRCTNLGLGPKGETRENVRMYSCMMQNCMMHDV